MKQPVLKKTVFGLLLFFAFGCAQAEKPDIGAILDALGQRHKAAPVANPPAGSAKPADNASGQAQSTASNGPSDRALLLTALRSGQISDAQEDEVGRQIAGNLLGAAPLVSDDALQIYVNQVGRWVSLQGERPDLAWHFGVIDSNDINAFSTPGGYLFITKGLYRELANEAEMASVFGHEIGHVLKRHHLKLLQKSARIAFIGKALQSAVGKPAADNDAALLQNLIGNGAAIAARSLDKNSEYEADLIGMVLTARAGYDPYALPMVLEKIGHAGKVSQSRTALLFKTHPLPDDRLDHLAAAVGAGMDRYANGKTLDQRFVKLP